MFKKLRSFFFENKTAKQTVAKNTVWLTITNFGGRLLKAIIVIYAARVLGTAGYGLASYGLTLAGFLTLFIDPGINGILMREVSKGSEEETAKLFSTTFFIKVILLIICVLAVLFVAPVFSILPGAVALLPLTACIIFFDAMREFFSSFIRSREKMEWETGIFLLTNLAIVVFGFAFMAMSPTPRAFLWAYAAGSITGAVVATIVVWSYVKKVFSYFSVRLIGPILKSAWPFAITGALGILLTNTDILIISWMRSASDVGIYSAAIRIVQVLYVVPMILQYSTLPLLGRLANRDNAKFRAGLERTVSLIFLASVPLALGGILLGTPIMTLIFGQAYAGGGLSLRLLMLTLLFDYPAAIISTAIFAYDHQKSLIITSAIGGVVNVALDLLFIPRFGIAGSAVATVIAQATSNWYLWHMMKKINYFEVLPRLKKIIAAGAIMVTATACLLVAGVPVAVNIVICIAVYFIALRFLREPLLIEIKTILQPSAGTADPAA